MDSSHAYNHVLVFGIFDQMNPGHQLFLEKAKKIGQNLIIVVSQDAMAESLKGKAPVQSLGKRISAIRELKLTKSVVAGDLVRHSWSSIRMYKPDAVVVAKNQNDLRDALQDYQRNSVVPFDIIILDIKEDRPLQIMPYHAREPKYVSSLTQQVIQRRAEKQKKFNKGEYLADFVYGANDGIITTFAVVTGAVGASLAPGIVVILGIANLLADGFSMGASSYLSTLSERTFHKSLRQEQEYDIEHRPEMAREEVRSVLHDWDIPRDIMEPLVQIFTRNKKTWSHFIMRHEFDINEEGQEKPFQHAFATFIAFVVAGTLPILPYIIGVDADRQFSVSVIATAITLFIVGSAQSLLTDRKWWLKTGTRMLLVGGFAAVISFVVGYLVKTVFGIVV